MNTYELMKQELVTLDRDDLEVLEASERFDYLNKLMEKAL